MLESQSFSVWVLAFLIILALTIPATAQQQMSANTPISLNEAISRALHNNPNSLAASAQVTQAQAEVKQAQSQLHFQLTFNSASGISNASVIQSPPTQEIFGATQNALIVPIPIGPKGNLAVSEAKEQLSAATAAYESSEITLAAKTAAAYFDLLRDRALVQAAQLDLATSNRELSDARERKNAGDIPELDVLQAQVPEARCQAALIDAQSTEAISQEKLNDVLCRPLDQELQVVDIDSPPPAPTYSLGDARTMALTVSPDIAAADALARAAEAALASAHRYSDPAVSLQAIDERSGDQTSFSRDDTLQASVTVPIDDGGLGRSIVQAADSALAQARLSVQSAIKSTETAVSAAYLTVQSSLAEVTAAAAARDIAQTTYEKTRLGYANGLYPLSDALTAENAAAEARNAYIAALYNSSSARYTLDTDVSGLPGSTVAGSKSN